MLAARPLRVSIAIANSSERKGTGSVSRNVFRRKLADELQRFLPQLEILRRRLPADVIKTSVRHDALPVERSAHFVHLERHPLVMAHRHQLVALGRPPVKPVVVIDVVNGANVHAIVK